MLLIHKPRNHKLLILVITSICSIGVLLSLSVLTYTPELSHAESITHKKTIEDITYMQEMTPGICQNMESEKQYQLVDKRDDKTYWIAKLKDGNCWMTQNLDLDLSTTKLLTKKDSDLKQDWTPSTDTIRTILTGWDESFAKSYSYDPGEYVYTTPDKQVNCGTTLQIDGCENWQLRIGLSKNTNGDEQAHYLAGNYYNYAAASAELNGSICPRGWQLPYSGMADDAALIRTDKTFTNLFDMYGWNWDKNTSSSNLTGGTSYDIRSNPFYYLYSGDVMGYWSSSAGSYSKLSDLGAVAMYWSSTAKSPSVTYYLLISSSISPAANSYVKSIGETVRCVSADKNEFRNNVDITVNPTISLDVANEIIVEKSEINPSTADLKVKVSSNQPYSVNINAKEHAELISENGDKIPSNDGILTTAENNWGIQKPGESTYTKVTTTPQLFYQSTSPEAKDILFKIGISTSPDLPNGEYATDITITATQN